MSEMALCFMHDGKSTSHKTHQQNITQPLSTHFDKRGEKEGTPAVLLFFRLTTGGSIILQYRLTPLALHMDIVPASMTEYNVSF